MAHVFIPPLLVDERGDQEWYDWVAAQMEGVRDVKTNQAFSMPGIKSKSGKAIVNHAMEWAQYKAMQQAVDGVSQTEKGQEVRDCVLNGSLISLMPVFSTEIYRTFVPVWRCVEDGQYEVGYEDPVQGYAARSASEAYVQAQGWYNVKRQGEIDILVELAKHKMASRIGPFGQDIVATRLLSQGVIFGYPASSDNGAQPEPVVWEHGEFQHHNSFVVDGGAYRYGVGVSAPVAAILAFVAAKDRSLTLPPPSDDDVGRLAPVGWEKGSGDTAYEWDRGCLKKDGAIIHGEKEIGMMKWNQRRFTVKDGGRKTFIDVATRKTPAEILIGWACGKAIERHNHNSCR